LVKKGTERIALPDMEARTVAEAFINTFVCRFGVPLQIDTDQGRNFESKFIADLCTLLEIEKTRATPMRPQANGKVERFNRTLISMLRSYCKYQQNCWDEYLQKAMIAYRSSVQSISDFRPKKMVFGREIKLPLQAAVGIPAPETDVRDLDRYVQCLKSKLKGVHNLARGNLKTAVVYQKKRYDSNCKRKTYKPGQIVWLHDPARKPGICLKLQNKWNGPFLITKILDDLVCLVKQASRSKPKADHADRLYPYSGNRIPSWILKNRTLYM